MSLASIVITGSDLSELYHAFLLTRIDFLCLLQSLLYFLNLFLICISFLGNTDSDLRATAQPASLKTGNRNGDGSGNALHSHKSTLNATPVNNREMAISTSSVIFYGVPSFLIF